MIQEGEIPIHICHPDSDPSCAETCVVGLVECQDCNCVVVDVDGGPWGDAMDVILCLLPILFLLVATLKKNPLPTTVSLPMAAIMMFLVRLMYLGSDPLLVSGSIIAGFHEALSPLSIMFGAICLFETMESTLCMPFMMREMKALTNGHPVAELMLLFCFAYMVEGASGFGTPVSLGAPMLVSLGYPKLEAVVTLLLMNTFATVWGAAGTPIWFGFGNLGLTDDEFLEISFKGGTALLVASVLLLPSLVLTKATSTQILRPNAIFLFLSLFSVMLPALGLSFVSFEFPALIGGMVGCVLTAAIVSFKVGLKPYVPPLHHDHEDYRHPLDIDTTSVNHSIISSHRKSKQEGASNKEDGKNISPPGEDSLAPLPEEVSAQFGDRKSFAHQPSSLSTVSKIQDSKDDDDVNGDANGDAAGDDEENGVEKENEDEEEDETKPETHEIIEMHLGPRKAFGEGYVKELIGRTFPLWGTVLLLILTRIPAIGLKDLLTRKDPYFEIDFGTYGVFRMSASLVLQLDNILTYPNLNWKYELLYVPFFMPFVMISLVTMFIFRGSLQHSPKDIFRTVAQRLYNPAIALLGALALVQLLINEGPASPATIIGTVISKAFGEGWIAIAAFIGALGSFFSGSTTISNLTFGEVQLIAAETIGTSPTAMLALQAAGGSAGNGICINNIISACAVVGLTIGEGQIIARTGLTVFLFCVIATVVMLILFLRFD